MKGKNTLRLNIDAMHEAIQLWVSQEFTFEPKPTVVAVRQFAPTTYPGEGQPGYYEIDLECGGSDAAPRTQDEK